MELNDICNEYDVEDGFYECKSRLNRDNVFDWLKKLMVLQMQKVEEFSSLGLKTRPISSSVLNNLNWIMKNNFFIKQFKNTFKPFRQ